jgi:hypothetical protein
MKTRLTVRLLDATGALLAWAPVQAEAFDRKIVPVEDFVGVGEQDGDVVECTVWWNDLSVYKRISMTGRVAAKSIVRFAFTGPVIEIATEEGPRPPVIVRGAASAAPETGSLVSFTG